MNAMHNAPRHPYPLALAVFVALLAGCFGNEKSANDAPATLTGIASKGPLNGASVCAYAVASGIKGKALGSCVKTGATGGYAVAISGYAGDVILEVSGGTYTDEATGKPITLSTPLRSVARGVASGDNRTLAVTPLTELATALASSKGGLTSSNLGAAVETVQNTYGVKDILATLPSNPTSPGVDETTAAKAYGLALAAFSQTMAGTSGMTLRQLLDTAGTGLSSGSASVRTGYLQSLSAFLNSANNRTGITASQIDAVLAAVTVGASGASTGGAGCVADVAGSISTQGFTVPLNYAVCYTNLPTGSVCSNAGLGQDATVTQNLNQALKQAGAGGSLSINFSSKACPANALVTVNVGQILGATTAAAGATTGTTGTTAGTVASTTTTTPSAAGPVVDTAKLAKLCPGYSAITRVYSRCKATSDASVNAVLGEINTWIQANAVLKKVKTADAGTGVAVNDPCTFTLEPGAGLWMTSYKSGAVTPNPGLGFAGATNDTIQLNASGAIVQMSTGDFQATNGGMEINFPGATGGSILEHVYMKGAKLLVCGLK